MASGRKEADLVFKNAKIVDVYQAEIIKGDVAVCDGLIAGVGETYTGKKEVDLQGKYLLPGFVESHIHVESSYRWLNLALDRRNWHGSILFKTRLKLMKHIVQRQSSPLILWKL